MLVKNDGNTPVTECPDCGDVEIIMCTISGTGINCECGNLVGYVNDLPDAGLQECHLVRIG